MMKVTVKVGQSVEFDVPVEGEPPPTCTWSFGDKPVEVNGTNSKVDNEEYLTHLRMHNVTRAMAGKYTLKAVNTSGEDQADVEVAL